MIDWETAAPGARVWDVAYAALWLGAGSQMRRWSYGTHRSRPAGWRPSVTRTAWVAGIEPASSPTVVRRIEHVRDLILSEAAKGNPVFAAHLADGRVVGYEADLEYVRASASRSANGSDEGAPSGRLPSMGEVRNR